MYSEEKLREVALHITTYKSDFDTAFFLSYFKTKDWNEAELKQRVRTISNALHASLHLDYKSCIDVLVPSSSHICWGYFGVFFADFVECFGQHDWQTSMRALSEFTKSSTGEFAIRPFIVNDEVRTMKQLLLWSKNDNQHIRRLSCEGCRPRLPWGLRLYSFVKDPSSILPILENLKDDSELYVRKSVANNLNDISKDHPQLVIALAKKWKGKSDNTDWIIQRAMRGLLVKGNKEALKLYGQHDANGLEISDLKIENKKIKIGEEQIFSFRITNDNTNAINCRIEYAIDYVKANGSQSRKVFQVSKIEMKHRTQTYQRKRSFEDFTTRKHYVGTHHLHIIVNGELKKSISFEVEKNDSF